MRKSTGVAVAVVVGLTFAASAAVAAEKDIHTPRVPAAELQKAKDMKKDMDKKMKGMDMKGSKKGS